MGSANCQVKNTGGQLRVELFGSLGFTGKGHGSDLAVITSGPPDFATARLMQGFGLSFMNA